MQITLTENIIAILAKLRQDQANILSEIKEVHSTLDPLLDSDGVRQLYVLSSRYISIEEECRITNNLIELK